MIHIDNIIIVDHISLIKPYDKEREEKMKDSFDKLNDMCSELGKKYNLTFNTMIPCTAESRE